MDKGNMDKVGTHHIASNCRGTNWNTEVSQNSLYTKILKEKAFSNTSSSSEIIVRESKNIEPEFNSPQ